MQRNYPYDQQMQQQQQQLHQRQLEQQQRQHLHQQQMEQQQRQQQNHWNPQPQHGGHGQGYPQMPYMHQQQQINRQISIEDAIGIAREQVPGQVVQAELEKKGGRLIYEVDIVTAQGVKYEVEIDANTGEVIDIELD